jgi:hypothetical protein
MREQVALREERECKCGQWATIGGLIQLKRIKLPVVDLQVGGCMLDHSGVSCRVDKAALTAGCLLKKWG